MRYRHVRSIPTVIPLAVVGLFSASGCVEMVPAQKFQAVQLALQAAKERNWLLQTQVSGQQEAIRTLSSQVANLADVEGDPADILIVPERIELASRSGGYDDDDEAGDDGIVLYVQPIDRDQHVVKAPGTLMVKLLDPLNPPGGVEFARYDFDWEHTRKLWYGRLMTQHFTVKCPWLQGHLPAHNEIIAHVVFTELVTGKSLTATGTYKIAFPPTATAPSQ